MNPTPTASPLSPSTLPALLAAGVLALPFAAVAETTFVPYVSSTTQYDSNLYRIDKGQALPGEDRSKSDLVFNNVAGLESAVTWSQQKLYATVEGSRFDYLNNSALNQNAFRLLGGLDWSLLGRINGSFTAANSRSRASFANADTTVLNTQRARVFGARTFFLLTNDVRFTGTYANNTTRQPAINAPSLRLEENTSTAALDYLGVNRVTMGLLGSYGFGDYSSVDFGSSFKQYAGAATLGYEATGLSKFRFAAGYTTREDAARGGKTQGFTGNIGYARELTGKTSVDVNLSRTLESFAAGDNSVIGLNAYGALNWEATAKIKTTLSYGYTRSDFRSSPGAAANVFTNRKDDFHAIRLVTTYEALRWLNVAPSFGYERRTTNVGGFDFDALALSLQLTARFE